ncbi:MAG TPA: hypothetical protein VKG80_09790 [Trebonia sp.]|nr:hypothetical protein [Trebonia sp.]
MVEGLRRLTPEMRKELTVHGAAPLFARVRLGGVDIVATGTGDVRVALANRVTLVESVSAQTLPRDIRRTP